MQHEDHHEQGTHPAHCHAFNQVVYTKAESRDLLKDAEKILNQSGTVSDPEARLDVASAELQIHPREYLLPYADPAGIRSSRGPPRFS